LGKLGNPAFFIIVPVAKVGNPPFVDAFLSEKWEICEYF
jgi:hypothetical protein